MNILQIENDIKEAMKAKDVVKLSTLRLLKNAVQVESKQLHASETVDLLPIIRREIKKRNESFEAYKSIRPEMAAGVKKEIAVLEAYLPKQMTAEEVEVLVTHAIKSAGPGAKMGAIMKIASELAAGRADGKTLSTAVNAALQAASA